MPSYQVCCISSVQRHLWVHTETDMRGWVIAGCRPWSRTRMFAIARPSSILQVVAGDDGATATFAAELRSPALAHVWHMQVTTSANVCHAFSTAEMPATAERVGSVGHTCVHDCLLRLYHLTLLCEQLGCIIDMRRRLGPSTGHLRRNSCRNEASGCYLLAPSLKWL